MSNLMENPHKKHSSVFDMPTESLNLIVQSLLDDYTFL